MDLLTFNNKKVKKSLLQLCYTKCVLEYFREIRRKSSNMKTEDKSNSPRVRIAVLGKMNVGKSALTVRYLTRRYIGEYRSNTDLLYRQTMSINNNTSEVEIVDVCNSDTENFPEEPVYWADACVVVYDVTSSSSLKYAADILHQIQQLRTQNQIPIVLLGNKADLEHLRETEEIEGRTIAVQHGCQFHEISVAENSEAIYQAFDSLISECRAVQATQKTRKFSVSKMIGTLIGTGNNGKTQQNNQNPAHQGGTVVVCQKSDLYKSRVLKRRQNFIATASL